MKIMKIEPSEIAEEDYQQAVACYEGWCTVCKLFTRDRTEPGAEDYDCPACGNTTVMGAEQALLLSYIAIKK